MNVNIGGLYSQPKQSGTPKYPNAPRHTAEDIAAARELMGVGDPNEQMYYPDQRDPTTEDMVLLPGADRCIHPLTGSGNPIFGAPVPDGADPEQWASVVENYRQSPYYHHEYVPNHRGPKPGGHTYCHCGNNELSDVHDRCWTWPTTGGVKMTATGMTFYGMPLDRWAGKAPEGTPVNVESYVNAGIISRAQALAAMDVER